MPVFQPTTTTTATKTNEKKHINNITIKTQTKGFSFWPLPFCSHLFILNSFFFLFFSECVCDGVRHSFYCDIFNECIDLRPMSINDSLCWMSLDFITVYASPKPGFLSKLWSNLIECVQDISINKSRDNGNIWVETRRLLINICAWTVKTGWCAFLRWRWL